MDKEKEMLSNSELAINTVRQIANSKIIDEKFKTLIKIANTNFDKDLNEYDIDTQLVLSEYTRIFNIEQFNYIISVYKPQNIEIEDMLSKFNRIANTLKQSFIKYNTEVSLLESFDVKDLLSEEIDENFDEAKEFSLLYRVHKLSLLSYKIEKEFQFRDWDFKLSKLKKNILVSKIQSYKINEFKQKVEKEKLIWEKFEKEYELFIQSLISLKDEPTSKTRFNNIMKPIEKKEVVLYDDVIKYTITFKEFLQNNPTISCANDFKILFNDYSQSINLDCANSKMIGAYIYYFRLINLTKMLLLVQEYGINPMYNNIDMTEILSEKLLSNSLLDSANLLVMDQEAAFNLIENDVELFTCENDNLSDVEIYQYMFCTYLNIEKCWNEYEDQISKEQLTKREQKMFQYLNLNSNHKLIIKYFDYYANYSKYYKIKNHMIGKVIDFPD